MTNTTGKARRLAWARRTALIGGLAAVTLTAGCSLPDWADMSSKPKPAATSSSAPLRQDLGAAVVAGLADDHCHSVGRPERQALRHPTR